MRYLIILLLMFSMNVYSEIINIPLQIHFVKDLKEIPINARMSHPEYVGMYGIKNGICHVWLQKPEDFFDYGNIGVLGHEVMHCYSGPHTPEYMLKVYEREKNNESK